MNGGGSTLATLFGFWMMVQIVSTLALILGGFYLLHCMGRYASSLDRLASAVENAVEKLIHRQTSATLPSAPPLAESPVTAPFSSTPVAPAESPVAAPPFGASPGSTFPASDQPGESR